MKEKIRIHLIEHPSRAGMFEEQVATQEGVEVELHTYPAIIMPNPSVGIATAHCNIIKNAIRNGEPHCTIVEDDCQFFSPHAIKHFLDQEPPDYDVYLGGLYAGSEKITGPGQEVKFFCGLHMYRVHQRFYRRFLNSDYLVDSIDSALSRQALYNGAKIIACYPFAAVQRELRSNNTGYFYKHKHFFNDQNTLGFPVKTTG